jgi:hypothetical protein
LLGLAFGAALLAVGVATGQGGVCERGCTAAALSGDWLCCFWLKHRPKNRLELFHILRVDDENLEPNSSFLRPHKKGALKSPVGSGFGFWSWRKGAQHERIYTHRLKGLTNDYGLSNKDYAVFYAGTTIYDASRTLDVGALSWWRHTFKQWKNVFSRREALEKHAGKSCTFWSHPSISSISLGAWFAVSGHGNGAQAGNPSSKGLCFVEIADALYGTVVRYVDTAELERSIDVSYGRNEKVSSSVYMKIRALVDTEPGRYVIVALGFRKPDLTRVRTLEDAKKVGKNTLAPNVIVNKALSVVDLRIDDASKKERQCKEWLDDNAVLRVLFIGRARPKLAIGIRWTEFFPDSDPWPRHTRLLSCCLFETTHVDEHDFSRDTRSAQADTCSVIGGFYEKDPKNWTGVSSLRDANMFTPLYLPPLVAVVVPSLGFYNFEVVCKPDGGEVNPSVLLKLLEALSDWHSRGRWRPFSSGFGRSEIRCCSGSGQFIWIDFAVNSYSFEDAFAIVMNALKPKSIALHTGKYDSDTLRAAFDAAVVTVKENNTLYSPPPLLTPYKVFGGVARDVSSALFGDIEGSLPMHMLRA